MARATTRPAASTEARRASLPRVHDSRRRLWPRLSLGAGATLLAVAAVEVGLRAVGYSSPRINAVHLEWGYGGRPGAEAWHGAEGGALVHINARGFRDAERAFAKPPGTVRVAVLGDSYVAAHQVPVEQRFTERLEGALGALLESDGRFAGRRVEVLNFGVNGAGTAQELLVWRHEASRYAPDLVLLAFFAGNDPANNTRALELNPYKPYFTLDPDGEPVLDERFRAALAERERPLERLLEACTDASRVLQLLRRGRPLGRVPHGPRPYEPGVSGEFLPEPGLRDEVYRPPQDETWRAAWDVTESLLAELGREVEERGAHLAVVSVTTGIQVHPDPVVRARFAAREGVADLDYPDRRLAACCARQGIPCVLLAPAFRAHAEREQVYLHGFTNTPPGHGHWNALGHALAAEVVAPEVFPLLETALAGP